MADQDALLEFISRHPELIDAITDISPELNQQLKQQAGIAGEYRQTPMPSPVHNLGYDKWGSILSPTSPLEYLNAGLRQVAGGAEERHLMQQQIANLLRSQAGTRSVLGAGANDAAMVQAQQNQGQPSLAEAMPGTPPVADYTQAPGYQPEAAESPGGIVAHPVVVRPRRPAMPIVPGQPAPPPNPQDPTMQSMYGIKMPWE